jgi:lipopolysaccharide/colanic/teichoic acid biosynthesis glycosyltransferase
MDAAARADDQRVTTPALGSTVEITGNVVRVVADTPVDAPARQRSRYQRLVKPVLDFVGAFLLLLLTSPVLLAAAIAVRFTMGGPVILRQNRVGMDGRVFSIYKFRTMEPDRRHTSVAYIGEDRRETHKSPNDPRITPVGRFLRKWSLDELPQFFNVLQGDMSLVGPRPEMVEIVAKYEPWQHERHTVKPGVTGPWQISERGEKALHECTESDIEYLQQVSGWTDLRILALTPLAALGLRRGH